MVQAIFFDIDGTLISNKSKVYTNSTKFALEKLQKKGIYLFVATGRHMLEIEEEHLLDGLYFDGYITLNGQYCFNEFNLTDIFVIFLIGNCVQSILHTCYILRKSIICIFMKRGIIYAIKLRYNSTRN